MAPTFWTFGSSLISLAAAQSTLQLQFSSSLPDGSSDVIDPSFAGFGIEPSNLFSFTGYDTPNQLTFNLLDNLVSYTGMPPHLRIGGNTQDYMVYSEDQTEWTWITNPAPKGAGAYAPDSMLIGPNFFKAANRFPQGTPVTWGLNLAYQESDYIEQISDPSPFGQCRHFSDRIYVLVADKSSARHQKNPPFTPNRQYSKLSLLFVDCASNPQLSNMKANVVRSSAEPRHSYDLKNHDGIQYVAPSIPFHPLSTKTLLA